MAPEFTSEASSDSKGGLVSMKTKKKPLDKNAERFYCPFPNCTRSFAELWRLKVHYRAPPDIRGSGKERGHGTELSCCPRCGKTLIPGKHHTGCTQSNLHPSASEGGEDGVAVKVERGNDPSNGGWDIAQYVGSMPEPAVPASVPASLHPPPSHPMPVRQTMQGDPLHWSLPEMSGPTAMSTCSTTTATMIANEQASSWHMHAQPVQGYQHSTMLSESGGVMGAPNHQHQVGLPPALPPLPNVAPTQNVTRTHWRAWAECSMQTDLGAPYWPLHVPFPGFPPSMPAYVAESPHGSRPQPHNSGAHTQPVPMMTVHPSAPQPMMHPHERPALNMSHSAPLPHHTHMSAHGQQAEQAHGPAAMAAHQKPQLQQQETHDRIAVANGDGARNGAVPTPHFDHSHPNPRPKSVSHAPHHDPPSSGGMQLEQQRSSSNIDPNNAMHPHDTFPPIVEGFNGIVPHPPSSPPADDFDHLAHMLFDFSHFDNTFKKEPNTDPTSHDGMQPLPCDDNFMDDLYACDMATDDHSVFKILFEDEHHNTTSITSHMHRQRELSFNLDDDDLVEQTMP